MATREYLIKDLTVSQVKGYLKKFAPGSAKTYPNMRFAFDKVEKGALKALGNTDANGHKLVHWGAISISNRDLKLTPEEVDELCNVWYHRLVINNINSEGVRAEDVLKLVTECSNPEATLDSTNNLLLKVVAKAILDKSFCNEKLGYIMSACNRKLYGRFLPKEISTSICLSNLFIELNNLNKVNVIKRVSEVKGLSKDDTYNLCNLIISPNLSLIDYSELPEVTDFLLMAMYIEILYAGKIKNVLDSGGSRKAFSFFDVFRDAPDELLTIFKNTSTEVIADGLSVVMLRMAVFIFKDAIQPAQDVVINVNSAAIYSMRNDFHVMDSILENIPGIDRNEYFDIVSKVCQERINKCLKVLERLRSNFPCGNIYKFNTSGVEFFNRLNARVTESILDWRSPTAAVPPAKANTVDHYAFSIFDKILSIADRFPWSSKSHMLRISAFVRNDEMLFLSSAKEIAKVCGMSDRVEVGTGQSTGWRTFRVPSIEESMKDSNVKTPASLSFPELVSEISNLSAIDTSWFKLPKKIEFTNVDTTGLSKQKENMKAFIADLMLGFSWLDVSGGDGLKVSKLYADNLINKSRLSDYWDQLNHAMTVANLQSTMETIDIRIADDVRIDYEDFEPIFEVCDHVSELVNFINTPDVKLAGKYSKFIPDMMDRSNYIANILFPNSKIIELYLESFYGKDFTKAFMPSAIQTGKVLWANFIDSFINYYIKRLDGFNLTIRIPTTCKVSHRLLAEFKRRQALSKAELMNEDSPVGSKVKHMFLYDIISEERSKFIMFSDHVDKMYKVDHIRDQVLAGYDINDGIVTRNFEYYEKFYNPSTDKARGDRVNAVYETCRKLRNLEPLTAEEIKITKTNPDECIEYDYLSEVARGGSNIVVRINGKIASYNTRNLNQARKEFIECISAGSAVKALS